NSGAGATGKELFDIARVDPLRVYVSVPQAYAPNIKAGMKANVTLQEFPGQKFLGTVARTADAIDPATRTLNTEVDVPNKDSTLLLRPIGIGRDFGATLEILSGLEVSDQIVINPSDSLEEGQKVHVAKPSAGDGRS